MSAAVDRLSVILTELRESEDSDVTRGLGLNDPNHLRLNVTNRMAMDWPSANELIVLAAYLVRAAELEATDEPR